MAILVCVSRFRIQILFPSLAMAVLLAGLSSAALGQTTTRTITGTVTDAQGAAIVGARVVVRNTATGAENTAVTNDSGIYTAQFLQPGSYEINASQTGFATIRRPNVTVQVGQ